jgi:hypothetical protein
MLCEPYAVFLTATVTHGTHRNEQVMREATPPSHDMFIYALVILNFKQVTLNIKRYAEILLAFFCPDENIVDEYSIILFVMRSAIVMNLDVRSEFIIRNLEVVLSFYGNVFDNHVDLFPFTGIDYAALTHAASGAVFQLF